MSLRGESDVDMVCRGSIGHEECSRVLAIVSTPFQLMALLCLLPELDPAGGVSIDLVFDGNYPDSAKMKQKLEKEKVFSDVTLAERTWPEGSHLGLRYLRDSLFRGKALAAEFEQAFPSLSGKEFDCLVCSCSMRSSLLLKRFCVPRGKTIFLDDGAGSRSGMVFHPVGCFDRTAIRLDRKGGVKGELRHLFRLATAALIPKEAEFNIVSMYVFNPDAILKDRFPHLSIGELSLSNESLSLLRRIFGASSVSDKSKAYKYLFFTLPGDVSQEALDQERDVLTDLRSHLGDVLRIQVHPRRARSDFGWCANLLEPASFWELEAGAGAVNENTWLIGSCSTAQSSVRYLFGLEPNIILLHRLIRQVSPASCEVFAADLIELYHNKTKIHSPLSRGELVCLVGGDMRDDSD